MKSTLSGLLVFMEIAVVIWSACNCNLAQAQSIGNNAVYNTVGSCSPKCSESAAFIDASMLLPPNSTLGRDLCDAIYGLLFGRSGFPPYPSAGATIDARGVSGTSNLNCTHGSPWSESGVPVNLPSNLLLPSGTIVTSTGWVMPSNTHVIGQGDSISSSTTSTVIQAASTLSGDMIDFCSSTPCTAVAVENLVLDGKGNSAVNGIVNSNAGGLSYVDHVGLYRILGTGLIVGGTATGSGPYSNITFDTGSATALSSTACVQLSGSSGLNGTAGIRGLRCVSENTDANAAVIVDSSNNSIKDVSIVGFLDGVVLGRDSLVQNNVLINVIGDTPNPCPPPLCPPTVNVVHLSNNGGVADVTIVGLSNSESGTSTLKDDITGTTLSVTTDPFVGFYALGKAANNGTARLTTSPSLPTWASGGVAPTSSSCTQGSLYSCTGSSTACSSKALWGCPVGSSHWSGIE